MREVKLSLWQKIGLLLFAFIDLLLLPISVVEHIIKSIIRQLFWLNM